MRELTFQNSIINTFCEIQAQKKGKPAMMFASLDLIKDAKTGEMRGRTKEETEEVAFRHKSLMQVATQPPPTTRKRPPPGDPPRTLGIGLR